MKQKGYAQIKIAEVIEKHKSVANRELRRNGDKRSGAYRSDLAQRKYEQWQKHKA